MRRSGHRLDTRGEARNLAAYRVLVHDALVDAAVHFRLRLAQSVRRRGLVATDDRHLDLLHVGANAADSRPIYLGAAGIPTDTFLGGLEMRHYLEPASANDDRERRGL